jgi:hypothetical protein
MFIPRLVIKQTAIVCGEHDFAAPTKDSDPYSLRKKRQKYSSNEK